MELSTPILQILVADDYRDAAESLALLVESVASTVGFCRLASDGEQAVEMARQARPDFAVLDVDMPRMDGLTAGRLIRKRYGSRVVLVAVSGQASHVVAANQSGDFDAAFLKPVHLGQLAELVELAASRLMKRDGAG